MRKAKPILMTDWTVRAIANTKPDVWPAEPIDPNLPHKSQTRRNSFKAKDHNFDLNDTPDQWGYFGMRDKAGHPWTQFSETPPQGRQVIFEARAPYKIGDLLYVREGHSIEYMTAATKRVYGYYNAHHRDPGGTLDRRLDDYEWQRYSFRKHQFGSFPAIHMYKSLARFFLLVVDVRVERLWSMSNEDIDAEGIDPAPYYIEKTHIDKETGELYAPDFDFDEEAYRKEFFTRLDNLHGKPISRLNPWLFVIEFMRISKTQFKAALSDD